MARPTVMTKEVIAKLEEAFGWGCTDREACLWADISEESLYYYQKKNPSFQSRKESLKDTPVLFARKTVVNAIKKGDRTMSLAYLDRKKKDEFSTKVEQDLRVKELPQPLLGGTSQDGDALQANDGN